MRKPTMKNITNSNIIAELQDLAEPSYKAFILKTVPTKHQVLGVRMSHLRKLAKRIAKTNAEAFVKTNKNTIYEMVMLEGLVLSYMDKRFEDLLSLTETFLTKVDNWAQVDSTIADFKHIKEDKAYVLNSVKQWLKSDNEFVVRAGLIVLLGNYVEASYLKTVFKLSQQVTHQGYYVMMGNAWLLSKCMVRFPKDTFSFFEQNQLDSKTHNKAIQKCIESSKVSADDKKRLRTLKR